MPVLLLHFQLCFAREEKGEGGLTGILRTASDSYPAGLKLNVERVFAFWWMCYVGYYDAHPVPLEGTRNSLSLRRLVALYRSNT